MLLRDAQMMLRARAEPLFAFQLSELEVALRDGELSRCASHRAAPVRFEHCELDAFEVMIERVRAREPQTGGDQSQWPRHGLSNGSAGVVPGRPSRGVTIGATRCAR
jgi:hypothetical protein